MNSCCARFLTYRPCPWTPKPLRTSSLTPVGRLLKNISDRAAQQFQHNLQTNPPGRQRDLFMSIGENMIETWRWLCDDPRFHDLPYRFELSREGVIKLTPRLIYQGRMKAEVAFILRRCRSDGAGFISLSTITPDAIFEVDVAWSLDGRRIEIQDFADPAPDICVELQAKSIEDPEFTRKKDAYFAAGAKEVWFVDREGNTTFYTGAGPLPKSHLMPNFPSLIAQ